MPCYVIPHDVDRMCAECTRRGRTCVTSSWAALDRANVLLAEKISCDEKKVEDLLDQLQVIRLRLRHSRWMHEQNKQKAREKYKGLAGLMSAFGQEQIDMISGLDLDLDHQALDSPSALWVAGNISSDEPSAGSVPLHVAFER